jgi:hypothetical protein
MIFVRIRSVFIPSPRVVFSPSFPRSKKENQRRPLSAFPQIRVFPTAQERNEQDKTSLRAPLPFQSPIRHPPPATLLPFFTTVTASRACFPLPRVRQPAKVREIAPTYINRFINHAVLSPSGVESGGCTHRCGRG